ncbi:hypothetical protein ACLOJK_041336 [Asimina triloba]
MKIDWSYGHQSLVIRQHQIIIVIEFAHRNKEGRRCHWWVFCLKEGSKLKVATVGFSPKKKSERHPSCEEDERQNKDAGLALERRGDTARRVRWAIRRSPIGDIKGSGGLMKDAFNYGSVLCRGR